MRCDPLRVLRLLIRAALCSVLFPALAGADPLEEGMTREPILAGTWYPADAKELRGDIDAYLAEGSAGSTPPCAILVPHAGYQYSGPTAGLGFARIRGASFDRVILIGPSHRLPFEGAALAADDRWRTPLGLVDLDSEAIQGLESAPGFRMLPAAHAREHCLEIEVPFLQTALAPGFRLVPVVIGRTNPRILRQIADALRPLTGERTLVVVSSDFTHFGPNYGYEPFRTNIPERIRDLDDKAMQAIETGQPDRFRAFIDETGATVCGAEPILVLLELIGGKAEARRLGYRRSGDIVGDFTNSVSYVAMAFEPAGRGAAAVTEQDRHHAGESRPVPLDEREQGLLLGLARRAIRARLDGTTPPPASLPPEIRPDTPLRERRGVFVTLTEHGQLRGCIGSIFATEPLVDGVLRQAGNAAFEDPRFPPLRKGEFDSVSIEISVLTEPVEVRGYEEIVIGRHGVLLEKEGRRAVFLPQVATEQGWDRDTMLRHLSRKAGLGPEDWRSGATFRVFESQIFEEEHRP